MNDTSTRRYRRGLDQPIPAWTSYPYAMRRFRSGADERALRALFEPVRAGAAGSGAAADWRRALAADPGLAFLAETPHGGLVAACVARADGTVAGLAVAPGFRRQGLATMLLSHICQAFQERGAPALDLELDVGNHAAVALMAALGWTPAPRRADGQARHDVREEALQ